MSGSGPRTGTRLLRGESRRNRHHSFPARVWGASGSTAQFTFSLFGGGLPGGDGAEGPPAGRKVVYTTWSGVIQFHNFYRPPESYKPPPPPYPPRLPPGSCQPFLLPGHPDPNPVSRGHPRRRDPVRVEWSGVETFGPGTLWGRETTGEGVYGNGCTPTLTWGQGEPVGSVRVR